MWQVFMGRLVHLKTHKKSHSWPASINWRQLSAEMQSTICWNPTRATFKWLLHLEPFPRTPQQFPITNQPLDEWDVYWDWVSTSNLCCRPSSICCPKFGLHTQKVSIARVTQRTHCSHLIVHVHNFHRSLGNCGWKWRKAYARSKGIWRCHLYAFA